MKVQFGFLAVLMAYLLGNFTEASAGLSSSGLHEGLHERILALSKELKASPLDAKLYLKRGELHRRHGDLPLAWADCEAARAHAPTDAAVSWLAAQLHAEEGRDAAALAALKPYLVANASHAPGFALRAKIQARSGSMQAALSDWAKAIELSDPPSPDLYFERAQALGRVDRTVEAIQSLDAARSKLGRLPALELQAVAFEDRLGRFDSALKRLQALAPESSAPPEWLARKAEILARAGRPEESRQAWLTTLHRLNQLPAKRNATHSAKELRLRIQKALKGFRSTQQSH